MDEVLGMFSDVVQSGVMPVVLLVLRIIVLFMTMYVIWRCYTSFKKGLRRKDPVIMLVNHDAKLKYPILYWENSIGRSKSCDIILPNETVSRDHAVLMRRDSGWMICDTGSTGGVFVNGKRIEDRKVLNLGDDIMIGGNTLTLMNADQVPSNKRRIFRGFSSTAASPFKLMLVTTLIHVMMAAQLCLNTPDFDLKPFFYAAVLFVVGWTWFGISSFALRRVSFELETIGLLLSGIGILLTCGFNAEKTEPKMTTQLAAMVIGIVIFSFMIWFMSNLERIEKFRYPVAIASLAFFLVNLLFGSDIMGARNSIRLGGLSIQPSELIKIAFIFFGAATLDRLQTKKNVTEFLIFTAACLLFLFAMRDFGTALVFFATFLIIAFMRSGSIRTIVMVVAAALLGVMLILRFMPHVADRFTIWRHVWDDPWDFGFQQTRMLTYFASGGLVGVGLGSGFLYSIGAAESDLTFGILGEEMGILMAFVLVAAIAIFTFYSRSDVTRSRSTLYSISSCAAAGLLLFQMALHVFGQSDIIPFTGVTFPFISIGGSSMMSSWGLLAFMKASDERTYAAKRMTRKQMKEADERVRQERIEREMQRRAGAARRSSGGMADTRSRSGQPMRDTAANRSVQGQR